MRGPVALSCLSWILRERKAGLYLTLVEFRRDGSFVTQVAHEPAVLAEAWRRAVLLLFVCQGWLEEDAAARCSPGRTRGSARTASPQGGRAGGREHAASGGRAPFEALRARRARSGEVAGGEKALRRRPGGG